MEERKAPSVMEMLIDSLVEQVAGRVKKMLLEDPEFMKIPADDIEGLDKMIDRHLEHNTNFINGEDAERICEDIIKNANFTIDVNVN